MVARCAVLFLSDLNVHQNVLGSVCPGGRKPIFSPFYLRPVSLNTSHAVLVYISLKGAGNKYTFLCEANTCFVTNSFEL